MQHNQLQEPRWFRSWKPVAYFTLLLILLVQPGSTPCSVAPGEHGICLSAQELESRVLGILEHQDRPKQGSSSGALPKSLLWSHAISFRRSDNGNDNELPTDESAQQIAGGEISIASGVNAATLGHEQMNHNDRNKRLGCLKQLSAIEARSQATSPEGLLLGTPDTCKLNMAFSSMFAQAVL